MTAEQNMGDDSFSRLIGLINSPYKAGREESGYLILEESSNIQKPGSLHEIRLFLRDVEKVEAFKFDQVIVEPRQTAEELPEGNLPPITHECFAPLLSSNKGNRSMCDYIVFFQLKKRKQIHVWAINMKSTNHSNNARQLRSAKRIIDFLLGKLEDLVAAESNKPPVDLIGQVDFVLFSTQKTGTNASRPLPIARPQQSDNTGRDPANFWHVSAPIHRLQPLAR